MFGDFQTPPALALAATKVLCRLSIQPHSILEPTCGKGSFLSAAAACFPQVQSIVGVDINPSHLDEAKTALGGDRRRIEFHQGDFFKFDWQNLVIQKGNPWLILGNPPWVTSSELGTMGSYNLPKKSNFHGRAGIEAITGKSNFDISEWMLLRYLDWLEGKAGTIAILCKTAVARKILLHSWKNNVPLRSARIYNIDAFKYFGAAVNACFFVLEVDPLALTQSCDIFSSLDDEFPSHTIGFLEGHLAADVDAFNRHRDLLGAELHYVWRSGVKHDCSKIMEIWKTPAGYKNGLHEMVDIEESVLFPMLKSSDIGNGRIECRGAMLVTQRMTGQDTGYLQHITPKAWEYLNRHAAFLQKRGSVIYKNKPAFSIFGVGPYTFAPWKVAISGFYKKLHFVKIGPVKGRPVVFDDTIYFLPCWSEEEACFIESLLHSKEAHAFFHSLIHWDEKRPITVDILKRLSIRKLAVNLGRERDYIHFAASGSVLRPDAVTRLPDELVSAA